MAQRGVNATRGRGCRWSQCANVLRGEGLVVRKCTLGYCTIACENSVPMPHYQPSSSGSFTTSNPAQWRMSAMVVFVTKKRRLSPRGIAWYQIWLRLAGIEPGPRRRSPASTTASRSSRVVLNRMTSSVVSCRSLPTAYVTLTQDGLGLLLSRVACAGGGWAMELSLLAGTTEGSSLLFSPSRSLVNAASVLSQRPWPALPNALTLLDRVAC